MPRTESLQLLSEIVEDLAPIGDKNPGSPLRSADWNAMVHAVTNLAKLVLSRESTTDSFLDARYARIDHVHSDLELASFDPSARAVLEEAMNGAVKQRAELADVRRQLTDVQGRVKALTEQIDALRTAFDGLRDNDGARARHVSELSLRVESLKDLETRVTGIQGQFGSIGTDLSAALDFRHQLVDDAGNPISIADLRTRVGDLETLRRNLSTADGELVSIRTLESAIARLEENAINRNDLDDVILERLRDGEILDESELIRSVRSQVEDAFDDRWAGVDDVTQGLVRSVSDLQQSFVTQTDRISDLETRAGLVTTSLDALAGLPVRVDEQTNRLNRQQADILTNQQAVAGLPEMRQRLMAVEAEASAIRQLQDTTAETANRVQDIQARVDTLDQLNVNVQDVTVRITTLEDRLPALDRTADVDDLLNVFRMLDQRVTANEAELDNFVGIPARLDELTAIDQQFSQWRVTVGQRLDELGQKQAIDQSVLARIANTEELSAENRVEVKNVNVTVGQLEITIRQLGNLPSQITRLDDRLVNVERRVGIGPG